MSEQQSQPSPTPEPTPLPDSGNPPSVQQPSRNLYVTGVDPCVTEPELLQLFLQYGAVEQHKLMVNIKTGISRGFGFVMFRRAEDAAAALAGLHGFLLYGKPLGVTWADDKTRTPGVPSRRLFIRNIPVSEHDAVATMCGAYGQVTSLRLHWDDRRPAAGASGGGGHHEAQGAHATLVAIVEMSTVEEAQAMAHGLNNSLRFVSEAASPTPPHANQPRHRPLQVKLISPGTEDDVAGRVGPAFQPGQMPLPPPRHPSQRHASSSQPQHPKTNSTEMPRGMPGQAFGGQPLPAGGYAFRPTPPYAPVAPTSQTFFLQHQHHHHHHHHQHHHHHHHHHHHAGAFVPMQYPMMMVPPGWGPAASSPMLDPVTGHMAFMPPPMPMPLPMHAQPHTVLQPAPWGMHATMYPHPAATMGFLPAMSPPPGFSTTMTTATSTVEEVEEE